MLITGATGGIGRAVARALRGRAHLSLLGRDPARLREVASSLEQPRGDVGIACGDLEIEGQARTSFEAALEWGGRIDALVLCHGTAPTARSDDAASLRLAMQVNLWSTHELVAAFMRQRPGRGRCVVGVSSILAGRPAPGYGAYSASKAAQVALLRTAALELAAEATGVFLVSPGWTDTAMARGAIEALAGEGGADAMRRTIEGALPLGRMATPSEVAEAIRWLVEQAPASMTGQTLHINSAEWLA